MSQIAEQLFDVQYDDMTFVSDVPDIDIDGDEAVALTARLKEKIAFPDHVVAVISVTLSDDDGEEDGETKCFVCVTVRVRAESEEAAENLDPPEDFLESVVSELDQAVESGREGNWEVLGVDAAS